MNITTLNRRIIALAIGLFFSVALLLASTHPAHASGAYPPSTPTSTATAQQVRGEVDGSTSPARSGSVSRGEASTGFDSVAASGAAIILLGGGLLLLLVGRRRKPR